MEKLWWNKIGRVVGEDSPNSVREDTIGLEQELTMPEDSYMINYFDFIKNISSTGPPFFFYADCGSKLFRPKVQRLMCTKPKCDTESLPFNTWSLLEMPNIDEQCTSSNDNCRICWPKSVAHWRTFQSICPFFLRQHPNAKCSKGGLGRHDDAVRYVIDDYSFVDDDDGDGGDVIDRNKIYITILKNSEDFYYSLRASREIAQVLTERLQNATGTNLIDIDFHHFHCDYLFLGLDFFLRIDRSDNNYDDYCRFDGDDVLVGYTSKRSLFSKFGCCKALEFCGILFTSGRSYSICSAPTRISRAKESLERMGSSILSGITLTDCGILILAFAKSKIFRFSISNVFRDNLFGTCIV
ncbi:NPC1-like intracellular cholesterol transporter 1 [Sarcoptes scabiei]|uniref:Niemann-Pick C1-like protein 1 n=1 Tax=Sarcoptes scabiei TaxID=52283 RepID=A0A834RDX4_SARSC|nr:NPC1-like intracellular cholesterol transporter 1 [Sarcoptes scabiei]